MRLKNVFKQLLKVSLNFFGLFVYGIYYVNL
jgi:hypothetical protein